MPPLNRDYPPSVVNRLHAKAGRASDARPAFLGRAMTAYGRSEFSGARSYGLVRAALRLYAQGSSVATCAPAHLPVTMASQLFQPPL